MRKFLLLLLAVATLSAQTVRESLQRTVGTNTVTGSQAQVPFQVPLLANLKAITVSTVTNAQVVSILGYTVAGDGGGGQWAYDSASVAAPNDINVVQPTVGAGRWLRISYIGLTTAAGGTSGQVIYNNSGVQGGFTANGDATINTATGAVTITTNAVTNAKAAQMPANTIKGNNTGSPANAADMTAAQAKTLLAIANTDVSGLGTMSIQNAGAVAITGGTATGLAISGGGITGLSSPTISSDAATKGYVDSVATGISPRTAVRLATTANITLSGVQTIDGTTANAADRVLVKNQTAPAENGIYNVAAGAWTRSTDSDTAGELLYGYYYFVSSGSANLSTSWFISTAPAVLGTNPVVFSQFAASQTYAAGTGIALTGNIFSLSNPVAVSLGGTGIASYAVGDLLTASGTATLAKIAAPASGQVLISAGAGVQPVWSASPTFAGTNITGTAASLTAGNASVAPAGTLTGTTLAANVVNTSISGTGSLTSGSIGGSFGAINVGANSITGGAASFTTGSFSGAISNTTDAVKRTTKGNFRVTINVKDYGAVGDGATNDTAAINSAIAALTNYSTLFFPAGNYLITAGGINALASISYVRITGEGARLYSSVTGATGNFLVVNSTCSHIDIDNLGFVGSATARGSGIGVRLYSDYSSITNCYFSGMSDFAIHVANDGTDYNDGTRIENNTINGSLGDGVHVGSARDFVVSGNTILNTGDDGIGVIADNASFIPSRGTVSGNHIFNTASAGIRLNEADDMLVMGNSIHTTTSAGIEVNRYLSTTAFNDRVHIKGNKLYNVITAIGPRGAIWMNFCNESSVTENEIYDQVNGGGIVFLDYNDLVIRGNTIRGAPSRGIASDDTTTTNVATNWYGLVIDANVFQYVVANQAIYVVPATGITANNTLITSNVANQLPAGDWIYYNRVTTGKVFNNTSRDGRTVGFGGTVTGFTTGNNN